MKIIIHSINEYRQISNEIWTVFKKYYDSSAVESFSADVHELHEKYDSPRMRTFMAKLMKVYFDELNEIKQLKARSSNGN